MVLWNEPDDDFWEDPWDESLGFAIPIRGKKPMNRYVVCYDIGDSRRRVKVAECLLGWGSRMQYSVFEVIADRRGLKLLMRQLSELMHASDDRINIYPLCASCDSRRVDLGGAQKPPVHLDYLIV